MTLHSSKGLEFEKVYLVGMEEELIPHKKTITEGDDVSEELRLCYVGITRAKDDLTMSYCRKKKSTARLSQNGLAIYSRAKKTSIRKSTKMTCLKWRRQNVRRTQKSFFSGPFNLDE